MKPANRSTLLTIFVIAFSCLGSAATAQDLFPLKRKPYLLTVAVDKKTTYEENLPEAQFVLRDLTVQLYPGENVFVEIEQENGVVKNVRAVAENKNPEKTLIISLTQVAKKKVHQSVMLTIVNPFKYTLKYEAKTYMLQYKNWVNARVSPIAPGKSSRETWKDVITSVAVGELAFQK